MNILNQPSYEQMDEQITVLREIAGKLGVSGTIGSWKDVQAVVRKGQAERYFAVGDILMAKYKDIATAHVVIGINHDTPTDATMPYSLTIQTLDCLDNVQFDSPEPTNPDANRQLYGNNRYIHSAIRQWLNSNDSTFQWVSQHEYDEPPTGSIFDGPGFLKLIDPELAEVIGPVNKQVARNTVTDGGGQDLFSDKVFLLSRVEVYGGTEGETTGETVYPYYSQMAEAATSGEISGRIKLLNNAPRSWWLRSPITGSLHFPRIVLTAGSVSSYYAYGSSGASPACCII
jgi:hypothetical protein